MVVTPATPEHVVCLPGVHAVNLTTASVYEQLIRTTFLQTPQLKERDYKEGF